MANTISQQRSVIINMLVFLTIVAISLAGFHGTGAFGAKTTCHQAGIFSCVYSICLVILAALTLISLFLIFTMVFYSNSSISFEPVFVIEKPPRW